MAVAIKTGHPAGRVAVAMLWLLTANRTTAGPELCVCVRACVCVCVMALLHHQGKVFFFFTSKQANQIISGLFNL